MKRYSPTTTETWLACPLKRHLRREWAPRRIGKRELGGMLGTGFAAGVAAYNSTRQAGVEPSSDLCVNVAFQAVRQERASYEEQGAYLMDSDVAQSNALEGRLIKAVQRYIAQDPIPAEWPVLDVERILHDWGECRIDAAFEHPLGPVVVDYKCKLTLDQKWLERDTNRFRLSEQRFHYSVAYGDFLGRPVYGFYICLVVLEPTFRTHLLPFLNEPVSLQMWRQAREGTTWPLMEQEENGLLQVGMAAKHHDEFGPCEFQRACFEQQLDPQMMGQDYVKGNA